MKQKTSFLTFLGKIEGLPVAAVLLVLYVAFIITAPLVFKDTASTCPSFKRSAVAGGRPGAYLCYYRREIDLSFSAVMAFSGFVFAWFYKPYPAHRDRGWPYFSRWPPALWSDMSMACWSQSSTCFDHGHPGRPVLLVGRIGTAGGW